MCGGMCIVIVNGKLAEIAAMNLFFLFGITTTKDQPYNYMRVIMMTRAGYRVHGCLAVNPEREIEFKISVTAGLQDKSSVDITQENP